MKQILERARQLSVRKVLQKLPSYNRFIFNTLWENKSKIIGLFGARGVGKTTLMLQLMKKLNASTSEALYVSCDHPLFIDINLFDFLEYFSMKGGKFIFIDEIHKLTDFQKHLTAAYNFIDLKIFFSGSSALSITDPDFARRFSMFKIPVLSLREFIELNNNLTLKNYPLEEILSHHEKISEEILQNLHPNRILKLFDEYNQHGAFPFYLEDPEKYPDRLEDTINAALYYDLGEIFHVNPDKIQSLKKLLATICVSKPLELSIEKLTGIIGITKPTLYKYLDYLSRAELILHIPHEAKSYRSIRKPDKLYLSNTNLFRALCFNHNDGTIRETFFASMLNYRHKLQYSSKGDFLVDEKFVFEIGGRNKDFSQIANIENSYIAVDDIEVGFGGKIPLWLFGFLY